MQGSCLQGSELGALVPAKAVPWETLLNKALRGDCLGTAKSPGTKHPARSSTRGQVWQLVLGKELAHTQHLNWAAHPSTHYQV